MTEGPCADDQLTWLSDPRRRFCIVTTRFTVTAISHPAAKFLLITPTCSQSQPTYISIGHGGETAHGKDRAMPTLVPSQSPMLPRRGTSAGTCTTKLATNLSPTLSRPQSPPHLHRHLPLTGHLDLHPLPPPLPLRLRPPPQPPSATTEQHTRSTSRRPTTATTLIPHQQRNLHAQSPTRGPHHVQMPRRQGLPAGTGRPSHGEDQRQG
jgi:hypothetical protein